jgi:uncharacterized protein
MSGRFEWDPLKAKRNVIDHGVSFKAAVDVFFDPDALYFEDTAHSTSSEPRDLIIGLSREGLLLVVFRERYSATRIISARRADSEERRLYEEQKN